MWRVNKHYQRKTKGAWSARQLRDEPSNSDNEVYEVRSSPAYLTRSSVWQKHDCPYYEEGDEFSSIKCSLDDFRSESGDDTSTDSTKSVDQNVEPIRDDEFKAKTLIFWEAMWCAFQGSNKYFQEGLTITILGKLKRSIAKEVRIMDIDLPEYPNIEWWFR